MLSDLPPEESSGRSGRFLNPGTGLELNWTLSAILTELAVTLKEDIQYFPITILRVRSQPKLWQVKIKFSKRSHRWTKRTVYAGLGWEPRWFVKDWQTHIRLYRHLGVWKETQSTGYLWLKSSYSRIKKPLSDSEQELQRRPSGVILPSRGGGEHASIGFHTEDADSPEQVRLETHGGDTATAPGTRADSTLSRMLRGHLDAWGLPIWYGYTDLTNPRLKTNSKNHLSFIKEV